MAIWTGIHGRNGLIDAKTLQDDDYLRILNSLPLDELKILRKKIESVANARPVAAHHLDDHNLYTERLLDAYERLISGQKSVWKKQAGNHYRNDVCYFDEWDGLGFTAEQDLLTLTGPMYIFGRNPPVQLFLPEGPLHYYHVYFTSILKAFKSDFILYAPEWYGICDGDTEIRSVQALLDMEDWRKVSSQKTNATSYVYFEDLDVG